MSSPQPRPVEQAGRRERSSAATTRMAERIAERVASRTPLRLAPRPVRRAPRVPFAALVGSVLLAGVVGLLLFNTSMQQGSFAASSLESRATELEARQQTLQMTIEDLRDPQRVARQARRLGMVTAGNPVFLDLSDGTVLGDPEVAVSDDGFRIEPPRAQVPEALRPERVVVVDRSLMRGVASRRDQRANDRTENGNGEASVTSDGNGQDTTE